jgi:hypothetical protein
LNFLNFDAKLDYYIFAARAREEKQSRPHREPLKEATPVKRDSLALACSSVCDVSVFPPAYLSTP